MLDGGLRIARPFFQDHFTHCQGCRRTGTPNPSDWEKAICLTCDFFRGLEGHLQTGFHLHECIGKWLEFTSVFVMHVRHEDAELILR